MASIQELFRNREFINQVGANFRLNMMGAMVVGGKGVENMDLNRKLWEEECPIEIGEGKKR